jgi:tetrapyrrole methylase family protein / MazG family protein
MERVTGMSEQIDRLLAIVARLRAPDGCPWDREQTHQSLLSSLLDETYEFFEAVEEKDIAKMREELGDLLLQIVIHSQMAAERTDFTIEDVAAEICEKLIRRHPHVFGATKLHSSQEVIANWERIKRVEKSAERPSLVDGIPAALPALFRAEKLQRRVARVGFDWTDMQPVLDKVEEEFAEFRAAIGHNDAAAAAGELGDILFALVNVARHQNICAEDALRLTIAKFSNRFRYIEAQFAAQGKKLENATLAEMDAVWEESKKRVG